MAEPAPHWPGQEGGQVVPLRPADAIEGGPLSSPLRFAGGPDLPAGPERAAAALSGPAEIGSAETARRAADLVAQARSWLPRRDDAMFGTFLGDVVRQVAPYTEADPVGILVSLMAALGVRLGPGPHVRAGDDPHPLLVWPLVIGHTGTGKKGTSWSAAKRLLTAADEDFLTDNMRSGLSSGEGIAALFADEDTDDKEAAALRAKARHAALPPGDRRLLVFEPEWSVVMARMKREGNSLSGMLRAAWEGGDLSTMNVTARIARNTHIGLLAHITPGEFNERVSSADMAGGTYNRFLPTAVAMSQALPFTRGTPERLVAELGRDLAARIDRAAALGMLQLTNEASQLWGRIYVEFLASSTENPGKVEQFLARAAPNCLRLAGIHAALDGTPQITARHLAAAEALVRYAISSAQAVLTTADPLAERLVAWIAEAGSSGRKLDEIGTEFYNGKKTKERDALLAQLVKDGRLTHGTRPRADGRPGRGAQVYLAVESEALRG